MTKIILNKNQFTTLSPDQIWQVYGSLFGIFRGGGNTKSPKLVRADGPRRTDLTIIYDPEQDMEFVIPDKTKGLSFADSINTLSRKKISGHVWVIPKGKTIPEGLIFNVKDFDHPLLNVSRKMSVIDMTVKLTQLADLMQPCHVKIDNMGNIIELIPGSIARVS